MFGRAPMMMMAPPSFPQQVPMEAYPGPQMYPGPRTMPPQASWPAGPEAMPPFNNAPAAAPYAFQPAPGRPVIRAQADDDEPAVPETAPRFDPPAPPVALPSPEQLGIAADQAVGRATVDWTATRARLDQLGATGFNLERLPRGGCRFTCMLPTGVPNRARRIEARAASEAEAVRLALAKAEEWVGGR